MALPDQVSLGVLVTAVPQDAVDEAIAVVRAWATPVGREAAAVRGGASDDGVVPVRRRDYTEVAAKVTWSLDR